MSDQIRSAIRDEIALSLKEVLPTALKEVLPPVLQEKVNGKIDKMREDLVQHNTAHQAQMERIMPIIEAFEYSERRWEDAQSAGWVLIKLSGFVTAVGSSILILRQIFRV